MHGGTACAAVVVLWACTHACVTFTRAAPAGASQRLMHRVNSLRRLHTAQHGSRVRPMAWMNHCSGSLAGFEAGVRPSGVGSTHPSVVSLRLLRMEA